MSEEIIEIWKDIPDYEGLYQVSNLGRVKSLSKSYLKNGKYPSISKDKILNPNKVGGGYLQATFTKKGIVKRFSVHALVAIAFLEHKPNGHNIIVDHINNIQSDNRLENLQLITARENLNKDKKGYTSIHPGVYWNKRSKRWVSQISTQRKSVHLGGYFKDELEAAEMYQKALRNIDLYDGDKKTFRKKLKLML